MNHVKIKQKLAAWFIPSELNNQQPHVLRHKTVVTFAVAVVCLKLLVLSTLIFLPRTAYFSVITSQKLITLTNQSREANGLPALTVNKKLNESAYLKAQDILTRDYFAHTSPLGLSPWYWFKQANYNYHYAGENLAIDFIDAESLYSAWLSSPTHRANILNGKYKEIGLAVLSGKVNGHQTTIAVQHFGTQFASLAQVPSAPKVAKINAEVNAEESAGTKAEITSSRQTDNEPILTVEEKKVDKEIASVVQKKIEEFQILAQKVQQTPRPRILGALAEKSDEINQQLTIYSILFVILALLLNIIIKFEIEHRALVGNTFLIILLIVLLLVVGDKSLLNINLNIL